MQSIYLWLYGHDGATIICFSTLTLFVAAHLIIRFSVPRGFRAKHYALSMCIAGVLCVASVGMQINYGNWAKQHEIVQTSYGLVAAFVQLFYVFVTPALLTGCFLFFSYVESRLAMPEPVTEGHEEIQN